MVRELDSKLLIAVGRKSHPRPSRVFAICIFLIALSRAAFCPDLVSVCEAKLRLCVYYDESMNVIQT